MKQIMLLKRQENITPTDFSRSWAAHGRMVSKAPEFAERVSGYIQNHVAGPGPRGDAFPYDGISEIDLRDGANEAADLGNMQVDEAIVDRDLSLTFRVERNVIQLGRAGTKILILSRRNQALTHRQYVDYWASTHVDVIRNQTDFYAYYRGYTQYYIAENSCRTLSGKSAADPQLYDGLIELWFDSMDAARSAFSTTGYQTAVRADEPKFLTVGTSIAFLAEEKRLL